MIDFVTIWTLMIFSGALVYFVLELWDYFVSEKDA